jgi:hypothetical protein
MTRGLRGSLPFIALGAAFLAIGLTGQRAFVFVGIVFFVIGIFRARGVR